MFERTLADLIRGLRANKKNEAKFISIALEEIRKELKSNDLDVKANAVNKLNYLHMFGYEMSWASFNVIEVMSSPKFAHKRVAYLVAAQSFSPETDVLMLATNLIKKDLGSGNSLEAAVALNGLSNFVNTDLARDLSADIVGMLNHSKPYIRKRAVLMMYKIFLRFPDALRPSFPRIKDKLSDDDAGVVSAAVNVICELASKNPQNYLSLAPQLFKLLTTSNNNWMVIKIIKLFGMLTPLEPRLIKKLAEPLANLIQSTPAMSLLYEAISTVTLGELAHPPLVKLAVQKLRTFIESPDQNLKYLGLLALARFLEEYPKLVAEHNDLIIKCIDDNDISIRLRALDLLVGMVSKKNLADIVRKLLSQLEDTHPLSVDPQYRTELVARIIQMCSQDSYKFVTDFEWYLSVLVPRRRVPYQAICKVEGVKQGKLLASQLLDVAIRVKVVRPYAVRHMINLLLDDRLSGANTALAPNREVLYASAWIVGEYSEHIDNHVRAIEALLKPSVVTLPGHIQAVYIQNLFKVLTRLAMTEGAEDDFAKGLAIVLTKLPPFTLSNHIEVQERASLLSAALKLATEDPEQSGTRFAELSFLFEGELNPVNPKAQRKVPLPSEIDLDEWIFEPEPEEDLPRTSVADFDFDLTGAKTTFDFSLDKDSDEDESDDDRSRSSEGARPTAEKPDRSRHDIFYLASGPKRAPPSTSVLEGAADVDDIPIVKLDLAGGLLDIAPPKGKKVKSKKKSKKGQAEPESPDDVKHYEVSRDEEMPEGAQFSDDEDDDRKKKKKKRPVSKNPELDMDRLAPTITLPTMKAYESPLEALNREKQAQKEREEAARRFIEARAAARKEKETKKGKKSDKGAADGKASKKKKNGADKTGMLLDLEGENMPAAEGAKKKKGSKKEEKAKKGSKSGKKAKTASADAADAGYEAVAGADILGSGEADPAEDVISTRRAVAADETVRISLEVQVDGNQENYAGALLVVENLSAAATVSNVELSVLETANVCFAPAAGARDGAVRLPIKVDPGSEQAALVPFHVEDITQPIALKTAFTYSATGEVRGRGAVFREDGTATVNKIDFKLSFPPAAFVAAEPCDRSRLSKLLVEPSNFTSHVAKKIPMPANKTLPAMVDTISRLLHLAVVETVPGGASLYGRSIQGHHVAALVKALPTSDQVSIDIKCGDDAIANGLLSELSAHF